MDWAQVARRRRHRQASPSTRGELSAVVIKIRQAEWHQLAQIERIGRLQRFLAPQVARMIASTDAPESLLESHRREVTALFCDLREFTAFTDASEPEEVMAVLREYHESMGELIFRYEGTLERILANRIMILFNDPIPCADHTERAVRLALDMRDKVQGLAKEWARKGHVLGFRIGIASGYATLGQIGFADRSGYTAIGTVCNLAARLCAEAKDGQILVGQRVAVAVEETVPLEEVGELTLKGLTQPVVAYNVPLAATQPALRVIEGGPQSV